MWGTKDGCAGKKGLQWNWGLHAWVGSGIGVLWKHGPKGFGVMACGCQGWGCRGKRGPSGIGILGEEVAHGMGSSQCKMGPSCPTDDLVLQVPARALLEGDTVTLRCRGRWNSPVTKVRFFKDENNLTRSLNVTELSLSPLQRNHSGSYSCKGWVRSWLSGSAAVTVTVHGEHPHGWNSHLLTAPKQLPSHPQCPAAPHLLPALRLLFYQDRQVVWGPQGSLQLLVPAMGVSHSGNYSCQVWSHHCLLWSPAWGPPCPPDIFLGLLSSALCPLTPLWCDPVPKIPHHTHPPFPYPPTPAASPSLWPQPHLCPHSACGQCQHHPRSPVTPGACRLPCDPALLSAGGLSPCHLHLAAQQAGGGSGSRSGVQGHQCGTFRHLPVHGHQPGRRASRVPGTQPRAGPGGDTADTGTHRDTGGVTQGRQGVQDPWAGG
uniref:Ig-like domain-containing protein n=1 Tax=Serinus canaria TaxID=9135 RepID=A0A8C9MVV7_SERCA